MSRVDILRRLKEQGKIHKEDYQEQVKKVEEKEKKTSNSIKLEPILK